MKRPTRIAVSLLTFVLVTSIFVPSFNIKSTKAITLTDWWPSFHHDKQNTGYTTSTGPLTNQTKWVYTTEGIVYSSAAVVNGIVYVGSQDCNVYALNSTTGAKIWNYTTGNNVYSSPVVADDVVYVGSIDGKVYALNVTDGTLVWSYQTGGFVGASPAIADGDMYIGSYDGKLYAFGTPEPATVTFTVSGLPSGTDWSVTFDGTTQSSTTDTITFTDVTYGTYAYSVGDVTNYVPSPAAGTVTVSGANVTQSITFQFDWWTNFRHGNYHNGYSTSTGPTTNQILWNYTTGDSVFSSPAVVDGVVYVGSNDGLVYSLNATDGTEIWNYPVEFNAVESSPAVVDNVVYIGTNNCNLYALNATTGTKIWNYTTGSYVYSSPAVADGVVYVGSNDHRVYAFAAIPTYTVSFVESGLASGTSWSVTFNGTIKSSTSDTISFTVPNGDYAYSVTVPSGYTPSFQLTGTVTVASANVTENMVYTQSMSSSTPTTSYELTILVVGNGTVSPTNTTYASGTSVNLEAISDPGWTFSGWSGDATGTANTTITMNGNKVVTATFTNEVVPEFPSTILLTILLIAMSAAVILFRGKITKQSSR
jgi:outer membrane protein assembly factor BamB